MSQCIILLKERGRRHDDQYLFMDDILNTIMAPFFKERHFTTDYVEGP